MKNLVLILSISLIAFVSCKKKPDTPVNTGTETTIDAVSRTDWNYYSFSANKTVGTGADTDNAKWFAAPNWDIAIRLYEIRTNSGEATTAEAKGGVFIMSKDVKFEDVTKVPSNAIFEKDVEVTENMGPHGVKKTIKSKATVITFKTNEDGSLVMPPVYLPAPIYIFKSADGQKYYKVQFTAYKDESGVSGKVKFKFEEISK